jgi:hypothetical protein
MGFLASAASWLKDLAGAAMAWRTVDIQIADQARELQRTIAASFEKWPLGLHTLDDLTTWASRLAVGFPTTKPALDRIVELRAKTWGEVSRNVGKARNEFNAAADIINPMFGSSGLSIQADEREKYTVKLRQAEAHVRRCLDALKMLAAKS